MIKSHRSKSTKPSEDSVPPKPRRSASHLMMDYLARRDHSESELRKKLRAKEYTDAEIDAALQYAKDHHWLSKPEVMAERYGEFLHRKGKGILAINHKLREKGLPRIESTPEQELEKALDLAQTKLKKNIPLDQKGREKIGRFLISRGFEPGIVRKVIYEKL